MNVMRNLIVLLGLVTSIQVEAETFKLGALLCLTGECAEPGTNSLKGIELAVDELNAQGGILGKKIEIITQDTKEFESSASAVTAYRNLRLNPEVRFIVGPTWSVGGLPLAPIIAKEKDILITSPSLGVAEFNEAAPHIFNTWPHDSIGTKALAKYAVDHGWKTAGVFSNQGPWESTQAKIFVEEYTRLGGKISAQVEPLGQQADLRAEALKIKNSNPDVVFFSNYTQIHIAMKELRRLHYTGQKLTILIEDTRLAQSEGAIDGTIVSLYPEADSTFREKFSKRFGSEPGIAADTAYDTVKIYAEAIAKAKSFEPQRVGPILQATRYRGASGEIVFDKDGGVIRDPAFWTIKDSKKVPL